MTIEIGGWASSSFFSLKTKTVIIMILLLLPPPLLTRKGIKMFSILFRLLQILLLLLLYLYRYSDAQTQVIFSPELNPQFPSVHFYSSSLFSSSPSPLLNLPPTLPLEDSCLSFLPLQFLVNTVMITTRNSRKAQHLILPCHMHCKGWERCTEEEQKP